MQKEAKARILINGNLHYFWDLDQGNPALITEFPTLESLKHFHEFKPNPDILAGEKVEADYIAVTQNPNYRNDPRWNDPAQRDSFIKDAELKFLRPIFSPTDFIQIKGRGTRKFSFSYREKEGGRRGCPPNALFAQCTVQKALEPDNGARRKGYAVKADEQNDGCVSMPGEVM